MACTAKEVISLLFYKICNPQRSDYEIEEQVDELKAETEVKRLRRILLEIKEAEHKRFEAELERLRAISRVEELRLKTLLVKEEAEHKRFKAELKIWLGTISESYSGPLEEKKKKTDEGFYLPSDVLLLILSRLALKDSIRSSAVCKTWGEIASSVRVRDRSCWLMYLDPCRRRGISYGFYDPIEKKKTKAMDLPWPSKYLLILSANDGWLLMREFSVHDNLYFFNPFTRERINLPRFDDILQTEFAFAFSCAPTKKGCVVFTIRNFLSMAVVTISTWRPGATTWIDEKFPNVFYSDLSHANNVLYSDGLFYMASQIGIGVYDPCAHTWNFLPVQPFISHGPETLTFRWIAEYKGHIFLVDASSVEPMVFRLNRLELVWERNDTLDGWSIFVSCGSCMIASGLTGWMSNIVYIWNNAVNERRPRESIFNKNRPYKYSLYSRSLCEDTEGYYLEYRTGTPMDGVWIEPPHNISIFDYSILDPSDAVA